MCVCVCVCVCARVTQVREALGVRRTIISGGGSLASHLDDFFEVLGLPVVNGWGLTETSPVLACRRVVQVRVMPWSHTHAHTVHTHTHVPFLSPLLLPHLVVL